MLPGTVLYLTNTAGPDRSEDTVGIYHANCAGFNRCWCELPHQPRVVSAPAGHTGTALRAVAG